MIVTFPNFGPVRLVLPKILNNMGIKNVPPPCNDNDILKKGAEISPEEMCIPFKYMVGNLIAAYEMGADTAIMASTAGPCRLGEYGQLMIELMKKNGYDYDWILFDTPAVIGVREFVNRMIKLFQGGSGSRTAALDGILRGLDLIRRIDGFNSECMKLSGYLKNPYEAVKLMKKMEKEIEKAETFKECKKIHNECIRALGRLEKKDGVEPVKILMAGEIYTSMEKEANKNLEERLMELGCSIERHINLSWWIKHTIADAILPGMIKNARRRGMRYGIGGYGRETVNKIVKSGKCDGIIKIMPSGCMPEIVTKAYCENLQKNSDVKILHLVYDEISGIAGYETRVEAFADVLERRKNVLARN